MSILFKISIDVAAAIRAGYDVFGEQVVEVELAALSSEQRETLATHAQCVWDGQVAIFTTLQGMSGSGDDQSAIVYPVLAEATQDAVRKVLDAQRVVDQQVAEKARKAREAWAVAQRMWLATPDDRLILCERQGSIYVSCHVRGPERPFGLASDDATCLPEVVSRLDALKAEANRRQVQMLTELQAREREKGEDEKRKRDAQCKHIDHIVAQYCNDEQQARHAAGLLWESEAISAYREAIFSPLRKFALYTTITYAEVAAADPRDDGDESEEERSITWGNEVVTGASAQEFARLKEIERIAKECIPFAVTCRLCGHTAGWEGEEESAVSARGILVTVDDGTLRLSREYACP